MDHRNIAADDAALEAARRLRAETQRDKGAAGASGASFDERAGLGEVDEIDAAAGNELHIAAGVDFGSGNARAPLDRRVLGVQLHDASPAGWAAGRAIPASPVDARPFL